MPCVYYTAEEERNMLSRDLETTRKELIRVTKELNKATKLLCRVCKYIGHEQLEDHGQIRGLASWWRKHKKMDKKRGNK